MYVAIKAFTDLQDENTVYHTGDIYPRKGVNVSRERIAELAGSKNRLGYPLIAEVHKLDPDGEPALENYEDGLSLASDSPGGVHPSKTTEAKETPKKARGRASKKG